MARHNNHNSSQMSRMDHANRIQNEPLHFAQKLLIHPRSDAPNGALPSGFGSSVMRSNDLPSPSYAGQSHTQQIVAPGTLHAPYAGYSHVGSSSGTTPHNIQHQPALSYSRRFEDNAIPSSHADDRRVAQKRRNPMTHPMDGAGSYYNEFGVHHSSGASSSNSRLSHYMPPNPIPASESCPRMPSHLGSSHWSDHRLGNHEGFQRNVRGRHDHNSIHLGHGPPVACSAGSIHGPPHHVNAIAAPLCTAMQQDRAPLSIPLNVVPPGTDGNSTMAFRERPYYPAPGRNNIGAPAPSLPSSSDILASHHGGYAPRSVHHNNIHTYPAPTFASSSHQGPVSYEPAVPGYPSAVPCYRPGISAASSSLQPFHPEAAASVRHPRHATLGASGSARSRRLRDSYHGLGFHPLVIEEHNLGPERFMMLDQLVIHESQEALDPHWDMRLDIDDMSYEELLALEERIGNVNTGLTNERISSCVEVICCSSGRLLEDQGNASCVICLEKYQLEDSLGRLKCRHNFHADCIKKWLQVKNTCPICKAAAA